MEETCLSLPFGDALQCDGPGSDATEQDFTGKLHDAESGLDYFGARYYYAVGGRFMSPDWAAKAEPVPYAKLDHPQTLNLYAYVGNNPLSMGDADGHAGGSSGDVPDPQDQVKENTARQKEKAQEQDAKKGA